MPTTPTATYPIGTPGQPWGPAEITQWRQRLHRQRDHAADVLVPLQAIAGTPGAALEALAYGELVHGEDRYPLWALRSRGWQAARPALLVTGGVHGYETSGVLGALAFARAFSERFGHGRPAPVNLLLVPCVSPWGWERIHRWNADAVDPNRSFRTPSPAPEAAALMRLVAQTEAAHGPFTAHVDLHETTDTDESEFRPALAARDGVPFEPGIIPDGFYVVDDARQPQPAFQRAIVEAVAQVTHIAAPDTQGCLIGSPMVDPGVIRYDFRAMGLCPAVSRARHLCTTEVYPDSARTTPAQCIAAQVAAVEAAMRFVTG